MSNTYRPSAPTKQTIVEEGSIFRGTLTSSCPIHVHGRIEGDLETPSLTVSATGAVHGKAKVGAVRSQGELSGEFDADSVELAGNVRDNTVIRARSLEVKLASTRGKLQVMFGECELSVGDEPTEHDVVEPVVSKAEFAPQESPLLAALSGAADEGTPAAAAPAEPPAAETMPNASESAEAADSEIDEDDLDGPEVPEARVEGSSGKRRRKRKQNDAEGATTGWSQPPSQPPPAN